MALVVVFAGLGMLCAVLWYAAVYALPIFVGFSTGFWALNHGAGLGCIVVGLVAGVTVFLLGRLAVTGRNSWLRWIVLAAFVMTAAYTACHIVGDLVGPISTFWRDLIEFAGAIAVGTVTCVRLTTPSTSSER